MILHENLYVYYVHYIISLHHVTYWSIYIEYLRLYLYEVKILLIKFIIEKLDLSTY